MLYNAATYCYKLIKLCPFSMTLHHISLKNSLHLYCKQLFSRSLQRYTISGGWANGSQTTIHGSHHRGSAAAVSRDGA